MGHMSNIGVTCDGLAGAETDGAEIWGVGLGPGRWKPGLAKLLPLGPATWAEGSNCQRA